MFLALYNHSLPQTTNSLLAIYLSAWSCLCPWPLPALSVFTILPFFQEFGSDSSYWLFLLRNLTPQRDWRCPLDPDRFAWSSITTKKEVHFDCQGHWELCTTSNLLKYMWWSPRCPRDVPSFLWNCSQNCKYVNNLLLCFIFICLMKHIRTVYGKKKILHFYLVSPLTLSVDIILNGSQITFL